MNVLTVLFNTVHDDDDICDSNNHHNSNSR